MTKQNVIDELAGIKNVKIKFFAKSPYMKRRYKKEFITPEAWIYTPVSSLGQLITEESYNDPEYRKQFFDMIREGCVRNQNF